MFTGKSVQVDAPCLDCGEPIHIRVRDGVVEAHSPGEICGYIDLPISQWARDWPST